MKQGQLSDREHVKALTSGTQKDDYIYQLEATSSKGSGQVEDPDPKG